MMKTDRLESLDILRGLDLFVLVCFQPLFMKLAMIQDEDNFLRVIFRHIFTHVEWEGFHLWDQVMPLFLFMAGLSIPFAFGKYKNEGTFPFVLKIRVIKRVILLWIFGGIVQGNFLELNIHSIYIYTDTLQAIACGYLFSVLIFMYFSFRKALIITLLLPIVYTTGMILFSDGYQPGDNLIEKIDQLVLGRFLYGASIDNNGNVIFASWYHIGWIYSSINFVTTVMSGVLVGWLLKFDISNLKKVKILLFSGFACLLFATLLLCVEPVIKRLWTSTMTFLSSGISILLMCFFYFYVDVKHRGRCFKWLKIYGTNSILAYMMYNVMDLSSLLNQWFHGFEPFIGDYYTLLKETIFVIFIFVVLRYCYIKGIFLKV